MRRSIMPTWNPGIAAAALLGMSTACHALTQQELAQQLERRGITCNTNDLNRTLVDATLRSVDPGARLLAPGETVPPDTGRSIATAEEWPGRFYYLKLTALHEGAGDAVVQLLMEQHELGMEGLVIDLRGAGGASIDAVAQIAALFVPVETELFRIRNARGRILDIRTAETGAGALSGMPVVMLIDADTHGASGWLAAVLRGYPDVILAGGRARGDNGLREVIAVTPTERVLVATRRLVATRTPLSAADGIVPDVGATNTAALFAAPEEKWHFRRPSAEATRVREFMRGLGGDPLKAQAYDLLLGVRALSGPVPIVPLRAAPRGAARGKH